MALEAPLITRQRLIKAGLETTKGTPFDCVQAIKVLDPEINWDPELIPRNGLGEFRGPAETGVQAGFKGICTFDSELRANGSGGMDAGLAILLQAAGLKRTAEVYQVHSGYSDDKTASLEYWQSGDLKALAGASANVVFGGECGKPMMCKFNFTGNWYAPITQSKATFKTSMVAAGTEAPMIVQSGTFTFATESIRIASFELDMGNVVVPLNDVAGRGGVAYWMISQQQPKLKLAMAADTVAGFDYYGRQLAGTTAAVQLIVNDGTDQVTFDLPKVESESLEPTDRENILYIDFTGNCLHDSGDDSVKLTAAVIPA